MAPPRSHSKAGLYVAIKISGNALWLNAVVLGTSTNEVYFGGGRCDGKNLVVLNFCFGNFEL